MAIGYRYVQSRWIATLSGLRTYRNAYIILIGLGSYHKLAVLRLNSWPDGAAISRDNTRYDSNSYFLVQEEDAGSFDPKIIVLPGEQLF